MDPGNTIIVTTEIYIPRFSYASHSLVFCEVLTSKEDRIKIWIKSRFLDI